MKNDIKLNISYNNNNICNDKDYTGNFINSIEEMFKRVGVLLEVKRIAEAENPMKELLLILNDEVITSSDIRMNFFK